jgi:hypothetical protein
VTKEATVYYHNVGGSDGNNMNAKPGSYSRRLGAYTPFLLPSCLYAFEINCTG